MNTTILRTPAARARLIEQLMEMPLPLMVEIKPHEDGSQAHQRAWYWWTLSIIADQAEVSGRKYSKEVWHEWYKQKFLPIVGELTKDGMTVFIYQSTEKLSIKERRNYRYMIEADAIQELGVRFPEYDSRMAG